MPSCLLAIVLCLALVTVPTTSFASDTGQEKTPVLVELFTSEGCSSCPPADALLREMQSTQPVPGVRILALGLHVDYWNYIGWTDRFSSAEFSRRQERYARRFNVGPYTPQVVVDGTEDVLGSDRSAVLRTIANAARKPKPLSVRLAVEQNTLHVTVEGRNSERATVLVALVQDAAETKVLRGENGGTVLQHAAIVRSLAELGPLDQERWERAIPLTIPAGADRAHLEAVVFVQGRNGRVLGAGTISLKASDQAPQQ